MFISGLPSKDASREPGGEFRCTKSLSKLQLLSTVIFKYWNLTGVINLMFCSQNEESACVCAATAAESVLHRHLSLSENVFFRYQILSLLIGPLSSCVFCLAENVALRGKASQAAQYHHPFGEAYSAIDGHRRASFGDGSCTHTTELEEPWWTVDLLDSYVITSISITNRQDCCQSRLSGVRIHIGNTRNNNGLGNPM